MKWRVLVSGGTGFLGQYVLSELEQNSEIADFKVLSRGEHPGNPRIVRADLTQWDCGVDAEQVKALKGKFDIFFHMAALYDMRMPVPEAYRQNVAGTHQALALAQKAEIPHFVHISTIAVTVGDRVSPYPVDRLKADRQFPDPYAATKAQAELMVRGWEHDFFSRLILRLGVLVGDQKGNKPVRLDGPYHAMRAFHRLAPALRTMVGPIPVVGHPDDSRLPVVPVDVAASAVVRLMLHQAKGGEKGTRCYHVTPRRGGLSGRELYSYIMEKVGLDDRQLLFMEDFPEQFQKLLVGVVDWIPGGIPKEELKYLLELPTFDSSATEAVLGRQWCPEFREYQEALWEGYEKFLKV